MNRRTSQPIPRGTMLKHDQSRRIKHSEPPAPEDMKKCHGCKQEYKKSTMHRIHVKLPGKDKPTIFYYCDECYDERYFKCHECGKTRPRDEENFIKSEGISVCNECLDEDFTDCIKCSKIIRREEALEHDNEDYCESCSLF